MEQFDEAVRVVWLQGPIVTRGLPPPQDPSVPKLNGGRPKTTAALCTSTCQTSAYQSIVAARRDPRRRDSNPAQMPTRRAASQTRSRLAHPVYRACQIPCTAHISTAVQQFASGLVPNLHLAAQDLTQRAVWRTLYLS